MWLGLRRAASEGYSQRHFHPCDQRASYWHNTGSWNRGWESSIAQSTRYCRPSICILPNTATPPIYQTTATIAQLFRWPQLSGRTFETIRQSTFDKPIWVTNIPNGCWTLICLVMTAHCDCFYIAPLNTLLAYFLTYLIGMASRMLRCGKMFPSLMKVARMGELLHTCATEKAGRVVVQLNCGKRVGPIVWSAVINERMGFAQSIDQLINHLRSLYTCSTIRHLYVSDMQTDYLRNIYSNWQYLCYWN